MIKRTLSLILLLLFLVPTIASTPNNKDGRRQMKTIQEYIKNKKGRDAIKAIETLRQDSDYVWNPKVLQYGVEANKLLHSAENEKLYLKSKPDTAAYFSTLRDVYRYILLTDSAERKEHPSAESSEGIKLRYRKQNFIFLNAHYHNLLAAARYFSYHSKWDNVLSLSTLAIETAYAPIATDLRSDQRSEKYVNEFAKLYTTACYKLKKHQEIEKYAALALRDEDSREGIMQRLVFAESQTDNIALYQSRLTTAHQLYPANMFFFSRLVDCLLRQADYNAIIEASQQTLDFVKSDTTLMSSQEIALVYEARAIVYHNIPSPRKCIEETEELLKWNPEHVRAQFYLGAAYYRLAQNVDIPELVSDKGYAQAILRRKQFYELARPHLEAYRSLSPQDSATWAPLLYETYLYLNLGSEFEEISKYIQ